MASIDSHHQGIRKQHNKLVLEGWISIKSFLLGLSVLLIPVAGALFRHLGVWASSDCNAVAAGGALGGNAAAICAHVATINGLLLLAYRGGGGGPLYQVAVRACFLGVAFGCGLIMSLSRGVDATWTRFGWYVCSLSFFHFSEYLATAVVNPDSLSTDSFLLNHSGEYGAAAALSWLEFAVEWLAAPELKRHLGWVSAAGLAMALCGDGLRKAAMLTAGSNFNHVVQSQRASGHVLVTGGVYAYVRHPAYVGWWHWSVGTQLVLCNPACALGYALAGWRYFRERVEEEELALVHFFGEDYVEYKRKVPTGLPFISGVRVN